MNYTHTSKLRIIPKLEIKNQNLIKGIKFEGLRVVGDPILFAEKYYKDKADQINIIDIVASLYSRDNIFDIIDKITNKIFIPVNVGGGINDIEHIKKLLTVGADRIIINSHALRDPNFLIEVKNMFGEQFISVSVEAKKIKNKYYCMMDHGRENSGIEVIDWVRRLNELNVCEIILNSIDNDGMENDFDSNLLNDCIKFIDCPLVVSGGISSFEHFLNLSKNKIDGICSATTFHFNKVNILDLKRYLKKNKCNINL
jgi:cyclase